MLSQTSHFTVKIKQILLDDWQIWVAEWMGRLTSIGRHYQTKTTALIFSWAGELRNQVKETNWKRVYFLVGWVQGNARLKVPLRSYCGTSYGKSYLPRETGEMGPIWDEISFATTQTTWKHESLE